MFKTFLLSLLFLLLISFGGPEEVRSEPSRIASLSLASDEILLDLIPQCGGIKKIVALSTLADDSTLSSVASKALQIESRVHSEPESLFALKPDLVIAATFNRPELLKMTRTRKIPMVILSEFTSAIDIANNIEKIGESIKCIEPARFMKNQFLEKINAPKVTEKPPSLILFDPDLVIMGSGTLFDDLLSRAGAVNAASRFGVKAWPKINAEALLLMNPDAVVVLGQDTPEMRKTIKNHPSWGKLRSVQNNKFIFLTKRTAQSTSHYFADSVLELRKILMQNQLIR